MSANKVDLNSIYIPSPCPVLWSEMTGDDRVRLCGQCKKNVYNLSSMTTDEAQRLIGGANQDLCVQFYRRSDGTIMTDRCPWGLRHLRNGLRAVSAFLAGVFCLSAAAAIAGENKSCPPAVGGKMMMITPEIAQRMNQLKLHDLGTAWKPKSPSAKATLVLQVDEKGQVSKVEITVPSGDQDRDKEVQTKASKLTFQSTGKKEQYVVHPETAKPASPEPKP